MDYWTQEDHDWLKRVQEMPSKYKIIVGDDCVWVETVDDDPTCVYEFYSYGYCFIHALLDDMGINTELR